MKTISKRLQKLERVLAASVSEDAGWGSTAPARDQILYLARARGEPFVTEMTRQLDELGPDCLWLEAVRGFLKDHGFVQTGGREFC